MRENEERILGDLPRNEKEITRISLKNYNCQDRLDLRVYYRSESGKFLPTKRGVSIPIRDFDEFARLISRARSELKTA